MPGGEDRLGAPALIELGVANFAAHMFIFDYAVLSEAARTRPERYSRCRVASCV
jgi:hypothetical protein